LWKQNGSNSFSGRISDIKMASNDDKSKEDDCWSAAGVYALSYNGNSATAPNPFGR
jgi:hypothetical protein